MVTQVIASGNSSTTALAGSTEAAQFAQGEAGNSPEAMSHGEEHASVSIMIPGTERTRVRL